MSYRAGSGFNLPFHSGLGPTEFWGANKYDGSYMKMQLRCGDNVESTYYNPATGLKGGRIVTEHARAICYRTNGTVPLCDLERED